MMIVPVVGPVEFAVWRQRSVWRSFSAHPGTEDESNDEAHKTKHQHKHTQVPKTKYLCQLYKSDYKETIHVLNTKQKEDRSAGAQ